jgi:hypothetical protein
MGSRAAFAVLPSLALGVAVSACADTDRQAEIDPMPTSITATGDDGADDGDGGGDTASVLDVGAGDGTLGGIDPDAKKGCDKVDFLFVVDNSGSMADEQQALIDSFEPFMAAIEERVGASHDFQVMVVDVDAWVYGECPEACSEASACDATSSCGVTEECGFPCALRDLCVDGDFACGSTQPFECEDVLGAGVTHPRGRGATSMDCEFATGKRYMDANEPDLAAAFACAAKVGTGSSADTEQPMDAMVQALASEGPAATCNDGFVRDDAILVVTFITDEDDDPTDSTGSPAGWYEAIAAAKGGDDSAIVMLGLLGDNDEPGGICQPLSHDFATGAEPAPRLREFVGMWGDRGHIGSVCATDYAPFFTAAVDSIGKACDEFVPQG